MSKDKKNVQLKSNCVSPSQATTLILRCMERRVPVMLWGAPGIGKSGLIGSIGAEQKRPVIDLRALLLEPTDVKGFPYYNNADNTMVWAPPSELPMITSQADVELAEAELAEQIKANGAAVDVAMLSIDAQNLVAAKRARLERALKNLSLQNAILFLDELPAAPPSTQAALFQLVLDYRIGEYLLPPGVSIVAAGNRDIDRAATFNMPTPLKNRFVHLELESNVDDWISWAVKKGVYPEIISFIKQHPHMLHAFDPESGSNAFATNRSWEKLSDLLKPAKVDDILLPGDSKGIRSFETRDELDDTLTSILVAGTVGDGTAVQYMTHRKFSEKLPNPRDVLDGRVTTIETPETSAHYTLTISLCYLLNEAYIGTAAELKQPGAVQSALVARWANNFLKFIDKNFKPEMQILAVIVLLRDFKCMFPPKDVPAFSEFVDKYKDVLSRRSK